MPVSGNHGLVHDLPLMSYSHTVLRRQFAKLLVGKTHQGHCRTGNYRIRIIIKQE